ncbi:uncharacterized protein zgc:152951 isoform X2 [Acanthochromis polyacanthus]|uniref:uncharacterized protein zgc:152951 isoform X2 n=1 Tax=Acanthochromis polyacanthus TaxID=80966 RepID=UPI00223479AC|nr:uncharacterized protein zgc:152951 isoform X2 [Acanthochromis polyacanthus]
MGEYESDGRGRVTVYSIQGCPHCMQAKATLGRFGVPVCDVDIGVHPELRGRVKELTGRSTVPQIFFNNVHIGGNDDLQKLAPEELQRLVSLVKEEPLPADAHPLPEGISQRNTAGETDGEFMCEKDELADLVEDLKHGSVIGCHRKGLTLHKKSFTGNELVDWLQKDKGMAAELSLLLRDMILKLFSEHLSADGKSVDYKGMSMNPAFERYCELAIQLQRVELLSLSREEKLAFFINIYNALVIHGNLRLGAPTNMWQRYRFFNYVSYLIGGEVFTLQDIENGVLRGNRKGIAQLRRPFSKTDPRLQMALPDAEPLIHFALNCGAKGCPPIKTYTPQDIDSQLRTAAEAFLENDDGCVVDSGKKEVRLSQIFKWYKADFGGTDEKLLNWVLEHMSESPKKTSLQGVLSAGKTKVSFLPYDWSVNSSH